MMLHISTKYAIESMLNLGKAHSLRGCSTAIAESHEPRCDSPSCKPEEQAPFQHNNRFHAK